MGESYEFFLQKLIADPYFSKICGDINLCMKILRMIHKKNFTSLEYMDLLKNAQKEIMNLGDKYFKDLEKQKIDHQVIPSYNDLLSICNQHRDLLISQIEYVYGIRKEVILTEWVMIDGKVQMNCMEMALRNAIVYNMKQKIEKKY